MTRIFKNKQAAREAVWDALEEHKAARFPFPPHERIPNFAGAKAAAERLLAHPIFEGVRRIKVNPDAPQRYVRLLALQKGITVYVPTPRLKGGFKCLDPARIPREKYSDAASLTKGERWAITVPVNELPAVDLIVTGCVAVTPTGKRCGKGHGYADIEYALFRELGHPAVPVVTTVHTLQVVDDFPIDAHDLPVCLVVTPESVISVKNPPPAPDGINWSLLCGEDLEAMPILKELKLAG